jgi:hypothetical protein
MDFDRGYRKKAEFQIASEQVYISKAMLLRFWLENYCLRHLKACSLYPGFGSSILISRVGSKTS